MRTIILKLLLLIISISIVFNASAQTCTGSLGDPVIDETFGAGASITSVGAPVPQYTDMAYTASNCPNDGQYNIATSTGTCFGGTWQTLSSDHTGNKNGYMMIINASFQPSVFYTQTVKGDVLCPNTTYQFAAWVLNILRAIPQTVGYIEPNLTFTIETANGTILKTYNTGNIKATDQPLWLQYGTFFTTPSDGSDIIVKLSNNSPGGNGNDLVLDDITFSPCGPIIQTGFVTIGDTTTRQQCANKNSSYTLVASQTGYDNPSYQWQQNLNDGKGWTDIAGATTATLPVQFTNPAAGTYQYRIGVLNGNTTSLNCRIYSQPLNIYINPYPVVTILTQTAVCEGQPLNLIAQGGDTYQWTGPNGFTSTIQNPAVDLAASTVDDGIYSVTVTSNGCPSFASTTVKVFPKITAVVSGNVTICEGSSITLSAAQSAGGQYYKWNPSTGLDNDDQATVNASPTQTTTYFLTVSNDGCSNASKSVTVTVLKDPVANAGPNKSIRQGESVKLNGTAVGDSVSYYWTPADHLDDPDSLTPMASPVDNTTYTLHVLSNANCGESTSSVFVRVFKTITIPNAFSPNNDGINDFWDIKELNTYPTCTVMVFNRYGQKVFESNGYSNPWDGTYNGSALPPATYYYIIDLKNNIPKIAGWVLIVK